MIMKHISDLTELNIKNTWLTIGVFDGVHRGHQALLTEFVTAAHAAEATAVVLTFQPHPAIVLGGPRYDFCLSTSEDRAALLGELGVDIVVTLPFTKETANIPAAEFVTLLRQHLGFEALWIGHDFSMGRNREGNAAFLQNLAIEQGFGFNQVQAFVEDGITISSTAVRAALRAGELTQAKKMLGRNYKISGEVIKGDGRGSSIGIPTANITVAKGRLVPGNGVYACHVWVDDMQYIAATNIGVRPTFYEDDAPRTIEAHLLDFDGDLYGKILWVEFVARLRPEMKFDGIDALIAQIQADIAETRKLLK